MKITGDLVLGAELNPGDLFATTDTGAVAVMSEYGSNEKDTFDAILLGSGENFMWPADWKTRRYIRVTKLIIDDEEEEG